MYFLEFSGLLIEVLWELVVILDDCRFFVVMELLSCSVMIDDIYVKIKIDLFFLYIFDIIIKLENCIMEVGSDFFYELLKKVKEKGFLDVMIVLLIGKIEEEVCVLCKEMGIMFFFKIVDMCVVEFDVKINYFYFIYFGEIDGDISGKEKKCVLIIGFGLIWIG